MMKRSNVRLVFFTIAVLLIVSLACLPGGEPEVDDEATQEALIEQQTVDAAANQQNTQIAQTQEAMSATQTAMAAEPTEAPATQPPPPTSPPVGDDTNLTIFNESNATVCYVNISLSTSESWGDDWLGADVIIPGGSMTFVVDEGTYDLRAQTCDFKDIEIVWDSFLSGPMEWTITTTVGYDPGDVMFFDEFDYGDPNWWQFSIRDTSTGLAWNEGRYSAEFVDGKLFVVADSDYTYVYIMNDYEYFADPYENVVIDARFEKVGGPNRNNVALICRYTNDGWYEVAITSGGLWQAYRFDDGAGYTLLGSGGSTAINLQFAINDLTLECIDNVLTLYVNGTYVGEVSDNRYREGIVGLSVSAFDLPGVEIEVDWFYVTWPGY